MKPRVVVGCLLALALNAGAAVTTNSTVIATSAAAADVSPTPVLPPQGGVPSQNRNAAFTRQEIDTHSIRPPEGGVPGAGLERRIYAAGG